VAFLPNYSVSQAERIFPACELSEQISTAGTEASGTGNMKAGLNGALTLGTLDGANVEIRDEVGSENIFIFGHTAAEIETLRASGYDPRAWVEKSVALRRAVDVIARGPLDEAHPGLFRPVVDELLGSDRYFLCADFDAYVECQSRAAGTHRRSRDWARMSILNVAGMGRFSSDRTVREYAADIWSATPVRVGLESASRGRGARRKH
jgi:starch phosphorylase